MPDLLLTGAFAYIDATMIEWHDWLLAKLDDRKKLSNGLQVKSTRCYLGAGLIHS